MHPTKRNQVAVPGILGGMGPLAHVEFEQRLIEESFRRGAKSDRDHPTWVLISGADIPDRTASLARGAAPCVRSLVRYGNRLRDAGADFMVVPCNTAHAFYEEVQSELKIPWLNLIDQVSKHIARLRPSVKRVGVIATDGTMSSHIYRDGLRRAGLEAIEAPLGSAEQQRLMAAIYDSTWGLKAVGLKELGRARAALDETMSWLRDRGAEVVVAGCTEFSVILRNGPEAGAWVDPLAILADSVLDTAFELGVERQCIEP